MEGIVGNGQQAFPIGMDTFENADIVEASRGCVSERRSGSGFRVSNTTRTGHSDSGDASTMLVASSLSQRARSNSCPSLPDLPVVVSAFGRAGDSGAVFHDSFSSHTHTESLSVNENFMSLDAPPDGLGMVVNGVGRKGNSFIPVPYSGAGMHVSALTPPIRRGNSSG